MELTKDNYRQMLISLLPSGSIWQAEPGEPLYQLLDGWAKEFARLWQRGEDLIQESWPDTAFDMITDYERMLALPNDCQLETASTMQQRKDAAAALLRGRKALSISDLKQVARDMGFVVDIEELSPSQFGLSRFGERFWGDVSKWYIIVTQTGLDITKAQFSISYFGEPFARWSSSAMECFMRQYIRADRSIVFLYSVEV